MTIVEPTTQLTSVIQAFTFSRISALSLSRKHIKYPGGWNDHFPPWQVRTDGDQEVVVTVSCLVVVNWEHWNYQKCNNSNQPPHHLFTIRSSTACQSLVISFDISIKWSEKFDHIFIFIILFHSQAV